MLKKTPLYTIHKNLGAKIVPFAGWEMPVQYTGVIEEHRAVRSRVGLFDICHMGEIFVTGARAREYINYITSNDIEKIRDGRCQYAVCCYEDGGVVDDVISYQFSPEKYLIVVNAANTQKDFDWFCKNNQHDVKIENKSSEYCQLALQGPLAKKVLQNLVPNNLDDMLFFSFLESRITPPSHRLSENVIPAKAGIQKYLKRLDPRLRGDDKKAVFGQPGLGEVHGKEVILSRTGYTGEDGFEIYGAWDDAPFLWEALLKAGESDGICPIGLAARDTLRLEAAYSLYGHEISKDINPYEARLGWAVGLDKNEFIGKKTLSQVKREGVRRVLVGLEMIDRAIPREGYEVLNEDQVVGHITSGTFSPSLEKAIGLALVEKEFSEIGSELAVRVRNRTQKARVIKLPFHTRKK